MAIHFVSQNGVLYISQVLYYFIIHLHNVTKLC